MSNTTTILYISDVNANETLFYSQVLPHIKGLRKNHEVILMGMQRADHYNYDYSYKSTRGDFHHPIAFINFLKQKKNVKAYLNSKAIDIIYSRGVKGGLIGGFINKYIFNNKVKLVNDVRADILDETKKEKLKKIGVYFSTKNIFNKADVLFFVSTYLQNKYVKLFDYKGEYTVCPTFVPDNKFKFNDQIRKETREKLNYTKDDVVLLYSGNLAKHQNIETILDAFEKTENKSLKLLVLTKDRKRYYKIKKYQDIDALKVMSVDYTEIQKYYYAADIGLLIRDNTDTNKSASPTKFSEYVNSGLYLCINEIDSDYTKLFISLNLKGKLLGSKNDLLSFLNTIDHSLIKRNEIHVNTLSTLVKNQKDIILNILGYV